MQINTKALWHIYDQKTSQEFKALEDVTTTFNQGEFITIIGHTGSGKTTFIEHLNALSRPTSGEVTLKYVVHQKQKDGSVKTIDREKIVRKGRTKIRQVQEIRSRVGIAFQFAEYQLFEETILKDIIFGPVTMKVPKNEAIELAKKYIKIVGLDETYLERSPFALSGGQKRRVALAGILAMEPDFLILDEPTAGLDPQGTKDMYDIFVKLHQSGKTIIIVTHNLDHVLQYSQKTLMFKHGKLIAEKPSIDLMYEYDFLKKNELEPPRLSAFVKRLEDNKLKIGKVKSEEELIKKIIENKKK